MKRWSNFDHDFVFPGGEALQSFIQRVRDLAQCVAADPTETVVVITHGGVIRFLICHYLGLDMRHYLLFDVQPASLSVINIFDQIEFVKRIEKLTGRLLRWGIKENE